MPALPSRLARYCTLAGRESPGQLAACGLGVQPESKGSHDLEDHVEVRAALAAPISAACVRLLPPASRMISARPRLASLQIVEPLGRADAAGRTETSVIDEVPYGECVSRS
jgi:hypothetical protein